MRVGLISDTHDNQDAVESAVKLFNEHGVDVVLHAGDWCAPFTLVRLAKVKCKVYGVFGNVDGERDFMKIKASQVGVELLGDFGELDFQGVKLALIHGKHERIVEALARSGMFKVVVRGHTHKAGVVKMGDCLIVNPGEACGYLTGKRTVAILDLETLDVSFLELP
ncbi:MAG: YfcE family phosphodiesterase [Candidatus Methanomethylicota archaeon]|uniref:Phosphoesterase n=1 Tax=Thermoproteota archaeon TaxID=2056631 RepID=A0A497F705_9CREN|nr:MAG: YfcE family phosphodiesterase [Candidatus Verstraetearchaeota archaeon]